MIEIRPPGKTRGAVLYSYIAESVAVPLDQELAGHSNRWESRQIARILFAMGFEIDVIDWNDFDFVPKRPYDVIFDIYINLQRLAALQPPTTRKLLHLTGSDPHFQNAAELRRVDAFEAKTGRLYSPKRLVSNLELNERSMRLADSCSLLGNRYVCKTFSTDVQAKTTLIPVTASPLLTKRAVADMPPAGREFLWFFGSGAVHKGLDLVLDVFKQHPDLTLHVVGSAVTEPDFLAAYASTLLLPNIRVHGNVNTYDPAFAATFKDVFCFIAPSCSEGQSPAVITCLQFGLYPIISRQTGVDLPDDCGIVLDELSAGGIERAVMHALSLPADQLLFQTLRCQATACVAHTREAFSQSMADYLEVAVAPRASIAPVLAAQTREDALQRLRA